MYYYHLHTSSYRGLACITTVLNETKLKDSSEKMQEVDLALMQIGWSP